MPILEDLAKAAMEVSYAAKNNNLPLPTIVLSEEWRKPLVKAMRSERLVKNSKNIMGVPFRWAEEVNL